MGDGYGATQPGEIGSATLGGVGLVRSKDGSLTLDEAKLTSALNANPNAVSDLFVTGGFATALTKLTDSYSRSGNGLLALKARSLTDRSNALQSQADLINAHADQLKVRLEAQFTALETAMTKLKGQSAYLSSVFG